MQYIKFFFISALVLCAPFLSTYKASAVSQDVVISQIQLAGLGSSAAGQEFIALYNNALTDVDITNWCLTYTSSSGATTYTLVCIRPNDTTTKLRLKAKSYAQFVSPDYKSANSWQGDGVFTNRSGMASTGGKVRLVDVTGNEIDRVVWGAVPGESAAPEPPAGKVLMRIGEYTTQDSDDSAVDFVVAILMRFGSGLYEVVLDLCPNIAGAQQSMPAGYMLNDDGNCVERPPTDACPNINELQVQVPYGYLTDENGNCQPDICLNIVGLQTSAPEGFDDNGYGSCDERDVCLNLDGMQHAMPIGYMRDDASSCVLDLVPLEISEILPNPKGSDTGGEYIELYNPSDSVVSLEMYALSVGAGTLKTYYFPDGASPVIYPREYRVIKDSELGLTLTNTAGRVVLHSRDGRVFSDTGVYASAPENTAWAMIDGTWQYTDRPTPGVANLPSAPEDVSDPTQGKSMVADCPTGKYRNPLTNRCRTIESDASVLGACDSDQYRNPETGRCRKIVGASTTPPCKEGQYRSEETNRCRTISTANATLTPCKQGQERNPDTNRCRTVAAKSIPSAAYAVEPVKDGIKAFVGWWAVGGISVLALAYAGWEWRREVASVFRRAVPIKKEK